MYAERLELIEVNIFSETPLYQANPQQMWADPDVTAEELKVVKGRRSKPMRGTNSEEFRKAQKLVYLTDEGLPYHPCVAFKDVLQMASLKREIGHMSNKTGKFVADGPAEEAIAHGVNLPDECFVLCDPKTLGKKQPKPLPIDGWLMRHDRIVCWNKDKLHGGTPTIALRISWKKWGGVLRLRIDREFFPTDQSLEFLIYLLNVGGLIWGIGCGRNRIKGLDRGKPIYGGMNRGQFWAELRV